MTYSTDSSDSTDSTETNEPACAVTNADSGEVCPGLVAQDGAVAVYEEHIRALNSYVWADIVAQYPDDGEVHVVGGDKIVGREAIGQMFAGAVKSHTEGGHLGLQFSELSRLQVGDTLVVQWSADADFLAEPLIGSDAYVTDGRYMRSMVTTFDPSRFKLA